jgi:hypothetical protein
VVTVGVLARFEFTVDDASAAEQFFRSGKTIVDRQPAATVWFAYRLGPGVYGAFAAFASDEDRQALLTSGGPKLAAANAGLFVRPPSFEFVDIIEARPAAAGIRALVIPNAVALLIGAAVIVVAHRLRRR